MSTLDQELLQTILVEIDSHLSQGILPVHNGHLKDLSDEAHVLANHCAKSSLARRLLGVALFRAIARGKNQS